MNVDQLELEKFAALAHRWWDPHSEFKALHDINPLRLDHIDRLAKLSGKTVLDVGCGGGILAESMAARGAVVTGIDLAAESLGVAKLHLRESGRQVEYRLVSAEDLAREQQHGFDVVTCMELLEHVPNPRSTVLACATLVKPSGYVFFATINRNLKSYLLAVVAAEYVLNLLPRGTHDYARFITPSELGHMCIAAGLTVTDITGMTYSPLRKNYSLSRNVDINYIMCCRAL
jgi:2-polyprenyl-6-hydroxyphenyl methylase / 3-demethylubiquinone-9 3-methyltransferase